MAAFHLTGIENGTISKDRTGFKINLRTDHGPLKLTISAEHLATLITCLQGLEYHALLNPKEAALGEAGQVRVEFVESHQIGNGEVSGVPSVILGLKSAQVFRLFALDRQMATVIQQAVADEIPKLRVEAGPH